MLLPRPRPRPEAHGGAAEAPGHPAWRTPTPWLASPCVSPVTPAHGPENLRGVGLSMPPAAGGQAAVCCGVAQESLALFEGEQRTRQRWQPLALAPGSEAA